MHDVIGDIHGHADAMQQLFAKLGYSRQKGVYSHPERQAIFLGDFIDRGPQIRETLEMVCPVIDSGTALAVMGHHELNALAFHKHDPNKPGEYLRPHNEKNSHQHAATMRQVPAGELASYLAWFRTLPLWLNLDGLRVVHTCWDGRMMDHVGDAKVDDEFLVSSCLEGGRLFGPVETLLKGKEAKLPPGLTITDKDGHQRSATRVKWFESAEGKPYGEYAIERIDCDLPLPEAVIDEALPYAGNEKPVFIGYY